MAGNIICCLSFSLCGIAFILIALTKKNTTDPITFFSGDDTLKEKVKDIKRYNNQMSKLYTAYGLCFIFTGILSFVNIFISLILIAIFLSLGFKIKYNIINKSKPLPKPIIKSNHICKLITSLLLKINKAEKTIKKSENEIIKHLIKNSIIIFFLKLLNSFINSHFLFIFYKRDKIIDQNQSMISQILIIYSVVVIFSFSLLLCIS